MAIIFTKDIPVVKLLTAYNNHIIKFNSNNPLVATTAQITGLGINVTLYPHPDGTFYFNFKDYVTAEINKKNFADDLQYNLIENNPSSFTYNVSNGCYLQGNVLIRINFIDESSEEIIKSLRFIAGAEQLEEFKKGEVLVPDKTIIILSPLSSKTNNTHYIKYWEGYPFEFSFYIKEFQDSTIVLDNKTVGLDYGFSPKGKVTSLFLSDGRIDVTLQDFLPLVIGKNHIDVSVKYESDFPTKIDENFIIEKADADCGVYVKFLNSLGRWNYWLLSKNYFRNRSSKYLAELENDFNNLEDTTSPTLQIGKVGDETFKCVAERLTDEQKRILEGIIDSPKIYLFTGERYSKANLSDWIEVRLKSNSFQTKSPNKKQYRLLLEFDMPAKNTITL